MRSALIVALFELRTVIRSKMFVFGVLLLPALLCGAAVLQTFAQQHAREQSYRIAMVDGTGELRDDIEREAARRTSESASNGRYEFAWLARADDTAGPSLGAELSRSSAGMPPSALWAEALRRGEFSAVLEIPSAALLPQTTASLRYYSLNPGPSESRAWVVACVNEAVRVRRLVAASMDEERLRVLETPLSTVAFRVGEGAGDPREFGAGDEARALILPVGLMVLLYLASISVSSRLLSGVLEEKTGRIAEVLLGAIQPFHLMLGKLLGTVALAILVAGMYLALSLVALAAHGEAGLLASWLVPAFFGLLLVQVLTLGAIFLTIGAACTDVRDSQGLSMPVILLTTAPAILWPAILENPTGTLARVAGLCPLASPAVLMLRLGISPAPAWWDVVAGVALSVLAAIACVGAAGRVFRVGLLAQGKSASVVELMRWILRDAPR